MSNNPLCILRLFVTTYSTSSHRAIRNLQKLLSENPKNNLKLEIIDIRKTPELAIKENIIALPLLVRNGGAKSNQRLIGDMSNRIKVIEWLGLKPTQT